MLKPIRLVRIAKIMKLIKRAAVFKYIRKAVQDVQDQFKFHPSDGAVRLSMLFLYVAHRHRMHSSHNTHRPSSNPVDRHCESNPSGTFSCSAIGWAALSFSSSV